MDLRREDLCLRPARCFFFLLLVDGCWAAGLDAGAAPGMALLAAVVRGEISVGLEVGGRTLGIDMMGNGYRSEWISSC